jgi:hypothetical protein
LDCVCGSTVSPPAAAKVLACAKSEPRTIQQLGASFGELTIAPATPTEPLPPLPVEVDDVHIFPDEIQAQQAGVIPLITGFNINVRIFLSYSALSTAEMAFGVDEVFDWDKQQRVFEQSLQNCRQILDTVPEILKVQSEGARGGLAQQKQPYYPPLPDFDGMRDTASNNYNTSGSQDMRRYEIQKANVYATHLATRSYLVEKYFALLEKANNKAQANLQSSPSALAAGLDRYVPASTVNATALEKNMSDERERVVKDLLVVLGSIDIVNMEPNGDSFVSTLLPLKDSDFLYHVGHNDTWSCPAGYFLRAHSPSPIASLRFIPTQIQKIRAIASTLLDVPKEKKGIVALQHQEYLYRFLEILGKLERASPETSDPSTVNVDEETELRLWADLRDHQLKFQEQGGVYGFS